MDTSDNSYQSTEAAKHSVANGSDTSDVSDGEEGAPTAPDGVCTKRKAMSPLDVIAEMNVKAQNTGRLGPNLLFNLQQFVFYKVFIWTKQQQKTADDL